MLSGKRRLNFDDASKIFCDAARSLQPPFVTRPADCKSANPLKGLDGNKRGRSLTRARIPLASSRPVIFSQRTFGENMRDARPLCTIVFGRNGRASDAIHGSSPLAGRRAVQHTARPKAAPGLSARLSQRCAELNADL